MRIPALAVLLAFSAGACGDNPSGPSSARMPRRSSRIHRHESFGRPVLLRQRTCDERAGVFEIRSQEWLTASTLQSGQIEDAALQAAITASTRVERR